MKIDSGDNHPVLMTTFSLHEKGVQCCCCFTCNITLDSLNTFALFDG